MIKTIKDLEDKIKRYEECLAIAPNKNNASYFKKKIDILKECLEKCSKNGEMIQSNYFVKEKLKEV